MENIQSNTKLNTSLDKPSDKIKRIIKNNWLFVITLLAIFIKSLIFVSYIASSSGKSLNISNFPIYLINPILYFSIITAFISFPYLFKGKIQFIAFIFINCIISLFMLCDIVYYRGFQSLISIYNLSQSGNLSNLWDTIFSLLKFTDIYFFIDIPILIYILVKNKEICTSIKRKVILSITLLIAGSGLAFYYHYRYDILEDGANKRYFHMYWSPYYSVSNMSPIGYHIYDSYLYFKNSKRLVLKAEDKKAINNWYKKNNEHLPDNSYKGLLKGKNLIVIQVESLEDFVVGKKIQGQEITPNINKLLKNSLYFPEIYEQVSGGNSSDADLMTNTSTHPVRSGATFFRFPDNKYNSLPLMLKNLGYYTSAFHPDGGGYWNWMPALTSIGFDKCTDVTEFNKDEIIGLGLSDGTYLNQLQNKIGKQKQPFYSFFVTLTSHMPFNLPKKYRELNLSKNIDKTVLGDYFQSINYTDKHIGKFIEGLDKQGILKNSVIVIYGDHTGVHKYYKDKLKDVTPREDWWFKDSLRIPFIVYNKDVQGKKFDTIGGQVDFLPTISYLMGVNEKIYINTAMGKNLLKTKKNFTILSNGVVKGNPNNDDDKNHAINALYISDKMLRSNYFKDK
ncbi:LTA synthase family protein [Clostridium rectalis]|uniref:LTA synthase family protein n=1 Tax=Clostridium rectalis TaxID=2040295 RepID=UPI000F63C953|nr:LTA synthase family protein [Clostridium rectalis]